MAALRTTRTIAVAGLAIGSVGCGSSDGSRTVAPPIMQVNAATVASGGSPAISDAISRILPAIDPTSADALRGPLTAVNVQVTNNNATALRAAIGAARGALEVARAIPADGPDLDAIGLAIDSVDPNAR